MAAKKVHARVLFGVYGIAVGQVIEADKSVIDGLAKTGAVDPDKDAVAYALANGGRVIPYVSIEDQRAAAQEAVDAAQSEVDTITGQIAAATDDALKNTLKRALEDAQGNLNEARAALTALG